MTNISDLDPSTPGGDDAVSDGDNQIANIKQALVQDFGGIDAPVYQDADAAGVGGSTPVSAATMSSWETRIVALEAYAANPAGTSVPVGGIMLWDTSLNGPAPPGWKVCDGATYEYSLPEGGTDTVTTPDYRGRFVVGAGGAAPNAPSEGDTDGIAFNLPGGILSMGSTDGSHTHNMSSTNGAAITEAQLPSHSHSLFDNAVGVNDTTSYAQSVGVRRANDGEFNYHMASNITNGGFGNEPTLGRSGVSGEGDFHYHGNNPTLAGGEHFHYTSITPPYWCSVYVMYVADGVTP